MTNEERIEGLERRIEELTTQVGILEDTQAIRTLQHKYGYYMDKAFYEAVVDLFSDDCEIRFMGGLFRGKAGAKRLFVDRFRAKFAGGTEGPKPGLLMEHIQLQDIIDVAPDRKTAKARFRYFMQGGTHYTTGNASQWWEGGLYENVYVKDNGTWKIKVIIPKMVYIGDFEHGWAYTKPHLFAFFEETYPKDPVGPDELCPQDRVAWPDTDVLWYHYPHPVTGAKTGMSE
ncbi:MAG: nuclear transport factor 2 family protein [Syntrophorhabdales bacterium]|jgi:hypothetical protein